MLQIITSDGSNTLFSEEYGVPFHSRHGAAAESAHVYIAGGLRYKAVIQQEICILEMGFGTGLNAMMTWLEAEKRGLVVHYTGIELYPLPVHVIEPLCYPELLQIPHRSEDFLKLHTCKWGKKHQFSEMFSFEKHQIPFDTYRAPACFDLIYFDAFAPQAQPEVWTVEIFKNMYQALRPDGVLVTYCAQGDFKRNLKKAGFTVERLQGPPGKREMTRGEKNVVLGDNL